MCMAKYLFTSAGKNFINKSTTADRICPYVLFNLMKNIGECKRAGREAINSNR